MVFTFDRNWAKCCAIAAPVRREVVGVGDGGQRSSSQTYEYSLIDKTLPTAVIAKGEYKRAHSRKTTHFEPIFRFFDFSTKMSTFFQSAAVAASRFTWFTGLTGLPDWPV